MGHVAKNIEKYRAELPKNVKLICVSKFHSETAIKEAYKTGERDFGESRVQELQGKQPILPVDIRWHFIGHLQTNKVKYIASYVWMIHGVDSLKLLRTINKEAKKAKRTIRCLLQIHIATEKMKFGFVGEEVKALLGSSDFVELKNIEVIGLMGMATNTDNIEQVEEEFRNLSKLHCELKEEFFSKQESFVELSMGMSNDYPIAIATGSTMIRIGTGIFGKREY